MLLITEVIIILVLIAGLAIVIIEERRVKKLKIPKGAVREYWNGRERRQSMRIDTALIVKYSLEEKQHMKPNGRMRDLSSGGMRLLVNEKLKEGVLLLLEFDIPNTKDVIAAEGRVIWADGGFTERNEIGQRIFQTGIQFINIKSNDKDRLASYIEKIAEKR